MNTNELLVDWSTWSLEELEARLRSGADAEALEQLFGAEGVAELRATLDEPPERGLREAVVLLPGIMGSLLTSIRGVTTLLWINPLLFLKGNAAFLELDEPGLADASPQVEAVPLAIEKLVYTMIALRLRRHVDLYEFPYDWRRPIEDSGDVLHACLERWADGNPAQQFTLVGHSMGGLVSRAYLARHRQAAEQRIRRVIMLGTPHFGAATAVENLINGNSMMALAGKLNPRNVPERLLLSLPSVYQLLPAPAPLFPAQRPYPANWDLYDAAAWEIPGLRQDYLEGGRRFYQLLAGADPQVPRVEIAGCHEDTIVDVQRTDVGGGKVRYQVLRKEEGPDSGDGTVPLWSAELPGAAIFYIQETHRNLAKNGRVIRATIELIHGGIPDLPTTLPERRAGLIPRAIEEPVELEAERLRRRLEAGTATEEELARLYFAF
jgi:pimeloyl-ACP methyl ester carboxylesterase